MKRILLLSLMFVVFVFSGLVSAQEISVVIDNKKVEFDVKPVIENGRTLVPFRKLFEELGLKVDWNESQRTASAYSEDSSATVKIGGKYAYVNGRIVELDILPKIVSSRTLVPLRFISEAFGSNVTWDNEKRIVNIKTGEKPVSQADELPIVGSYEKLVSLLEYSEKYAGSYGGIREAMPSTGVMDNAAEAESKSQSADYSSTNLQVEGVDESDIVKTDGSYIYEYRKGSVSIVRALAGKLSLAAEIKLDDTYASNELYLYKDKLIVIGSSADVRIMEGDAKSSIWPGPATSVKIKLYDISDKTSPKLARDIQIDGSYVASRVTGGSLYIVASKNIHTILKGERDDMIPSAYDSAAGGTVKVPYEQIRYFPDSPDANYLVTAGIDLDDMAKKANISAYLGSGQNIYCSRENLYVAATRFTYDYEAKIDERETYYPVYKVNTEAYKFALGNAKLEYVAKGSVPGTVLNQFSMDEYNGFFRIATTSGEAWRTYENTSKNNIYVLDSSMKTVGRLEGLAPTERIYSARFMGDRAYMVTFRQVDPFYAVDMSSPESPKVLGYLKIPGFSDYLHPYDENHIIGFGKETEMTKNGLVTKGMKIGLIDVSDVANPVEKYKVIIGDSGTYSELLDNHKALLFSKEKSLMALPVTVMSKSSDGVVRFAYQGAYAYTLDMQKGFSLRGRATHLSQEDYAKAGDYWYESDKNIRRIIYIGDYVYTISNSQIKSHDIADLSVIDSISFENK
ncbi:secreted protein [Peptoclostridium acidaminophilum DSM 3953]|uniref:Secreted protein n=1 Tax=Peptoclostridium acidaminophilum DSM 3953 TaxID=1286171 RepID=W8T7J1_PEPAC|nr:beta-propeller domain-containing protein [Peptoclostridium acidaminophilum]AHM56865.1 secreted protein [Peptoclostridium acidaminophilum DSM 3953]